MFTSLLKCRRVGVCGLLALTIGCAGTLPPVTLPSGAAEPAADALAAWEQATAACRAISTFSAQIHLSGRVGATRQKVGGTLHGALTRHSEIYLALDEPLGAPGFVLSGPANRATLVLPRDKRVLVAPAADIIEALTGLKLEPRELMAVLDGCLAEGAGADGSRLGDLRGARIMAPGIPGESRLWMHHLAGGWQALAGSRPGLAVNYRTFVGTWPAEIGLASSADAPLPIEFRIRVDQVIVDSPRVTPDTFIPRPPGDAVPMTLDELRRIGPLGEKAS